MKKYFLFLLLFPFGVRAQDMSQYLKKTFIQKGDTMPYRILLPLDYDAHKKYPMLVFLHGSGERGNDNELQLVHGGKLFLIDSVRENFPAIIVFPQCAESSYWAGVKRDVTDGKTIFTFSANPPKTVAMSLLQSLIKQLLKKYPVQKNRVYVGGLSMGGMGTQEIVMRQPRLFAAAFSICGGADTATAKKIAKIPWWFFHGGKDDVVSPQFSINMTDDLLRRNAKVKLTIYPEANHNSWDSAFKEPALLPWLFAQHK